MDRTVKIFCSGDEQDACCRSHPVIERYDGFVLARFPARTVRRLSAKYLVEDITDHYPIRIGDRTIDTSRPRRDRTGRLHAHPAYRGEQRLPAGRHHYLVEFIGPIKARWLKDVRQAGGESRAHYQNFSYVVRGDGPALQRVARLPSVHWVGHLPYWARIATTLRERLRQVAARPALPRTRLLRDAYSLEFFGPRDLVKAVARIRRLGAKILGKHPRAKLLTVEAQGSESGRRRLMRSLSAIHGVRSIRERALKRTSNDVATEIMATVRSAGKPRPGLSGRGEIIAVCDTGLDSGLKRFIHPDFRGRIVAIRSYPITAEFSSKIKNPRADDGPADKDSGHGTHVAGSILGSGRTSRSDGLTAPIRGLAWRARLVFQAVEQELDWKDPAEFVESGGFVLAGLPSDLTELFSHAWSKGARIHSNSWGGGDPGAYDDQCEQLDRFVWEHKAFCVLVAAGNDGTDKDGDGLINPMSVTSPATAKNCITVGACESRRPGFEQETYGAWWADDYPVAPFDTDQMANDPDHLAAFSSRGPTRDGRLKPDVVAPGTFILSTRSRWIAENNTGWAAFPASPGYFYMGGTSMATPLTAGAVALVREYLRTVRRIKLPTAALLKAAIVASAVRLPRVGPRGALCDNDQGFGRVNLDSILAPRRPASVGFLEVRPGLRTGEVHALELAVRSRSVPLTIVLAYSDFPGRSLVNDLNLIVRGPRGRVFEGNHAAGQPPSLDNRNNVEMVQVTRPTAGTWRVEIVGSNVPRGPQDFAVVCRGHLKG